MAALPCIYGLIHPETGALRYVGKANHAGKRFASHLRDSRTRKTPVYAWIRKLSERGLKPDYVVLAEDCEDWQFSERYFIASAKRNGADLLNLTEGGDQPCCSLEQRQINGRSNAAKRHPVLHALLRHFGLEARFFEKIGNHELASKMRNCQSIIRDLKGDQKDVFAYAWISRREDDGRFPDIVERMKGWDSRDP